MEVTYFDEKASKKRLLETAEYEHANAKRAKVTINIFNPYFIATTSGRFVDLFDDRLNFRCRLEHNTTVTIVIRLQNGDIACCCWIGPVYICNMQEHFCIFSDRMASGSSLIQLADGSLAFGTNKNTVYVWDLHGQWFMESCDQKSQIRNLQQLSDGRLIALLDNGNVNVCTMYKGFESIDTNKFGFSLTFTGHIQTFLELRPRCFVTILSDGSVVVFLQDSFPYSSKILKSGSDQTHFWTRILKLDDSRLLISSQEGIKIYDSNDWTSDQKLPSPFPGTPNEQVKTMVQLNDVTIAYSCWRVGLWNIETNSSTFCDDERSYVSQLARLDDGRLAISHLDRWKRPNKIGIWDNETRTMQTVNGDVLFPIYSKHEIEQYRKSIANTLDLFLCVDNIGIVDAYL